MILGLLRGLALILVSLGVACPAAAAPTPEVIRGMNKAPAEQPAATGALYQQGLKHLEKGNYKKAVGVFQQILQQQPQQAEALYRLGLAYQGLGDEDQAIANLKKALQVNPKLTEARLALGKIYGRQGLALLRQGDPEAAEGLLRQAVGENPRNASAFNNLGVALGQQGRWPEAAGALQRAVALDPNNVGAQFNLGLVYYLMGDKTAVTRQYAITTLLNPEAAGELFSIIQNTRKPLFRY